MKKILVFVIVLLVAVLMTVTVPDKEAHKEAMMKVIAEFVDEEAQNHGFGNSVLSRLGKSAVTKTLETGLDSKLEMDNYILLNMTHVHLNGRDHTLSLGILGHVFTFDKETLREKLQESLDR